MEIKVSVLLCVFNGQKSLARAIESILEQDFTKFEFLIINDGSTDNTENIIYRYLKKDSRIKYFFKKHSGLTNSLIYGLRKASGEWIARIDDDDFSKKNRLSKQLKFVEKNRKIVLLGSNFSIIKDQRITYRSKLPLSHSFLVENLRKSRGFFPHSSAFFSRRKAIQVGGYRSFFIKSQDHDLWLRLSENYQIACCKENLVSIYSHRDRITENSIGYPQYIYKFAAIFSYFARQERNYCLEKKINKNNFMNLLEIINQYLDDNKYSEILSLKEKIKLLLLKRNILLILIEIPFLLIKNRYLIILIFRNIFFNRNIAYEIFQKYKNIL